jgi:hypothetical protein
MSNELVPQQSGGYLALTDDDYLAKLGGVVGGMKGGGSFAYLKMDGNSGNYSYGADDIELPAGTQLAMDWKSLRQGWIIWSGGQVEHEVMVDPVNEAVPAKRDLPDFGPYGKDDGPREQLTIQLKMIEDPFVELLFQANNASKRNALGAVMKDFMKSFKLHPGAYPVIEIDSNSFDAKDPDNPKRKFKKYAPKFKIVDWISADELNAMSEGSPEDYEQGDEEITDATEGTALPAPVEAEEVVEPTPAPQPTQPVKAATTRAATRPAASRPAAAAQAPTPAAAAPAAKAPAAAAPAGRRSRF